jgi:hypothetical protein
VTVIYSAHSEATPKTRPALLPLLVILFIASYTILTLLVVEQGRTIEAQRGLLREMLKDSTQLADLKGKLARGDSAQSAGKPAAAPRKEADSAAPGNVHPKAPATREPRRPGKSARTLKQAPEKPAADLEDVRRSTREI